MYKEPSKFAETGTYNFWFSHDMRPSHVPIEKPPTPPRRSHDRGSLSDPKMGSSRTEIGMLMTKALELCTTPGVVCAFECEDLGCLKLE